MNGKVYIGQTTRSVEKRWKEHIWDAYGARYSSNLHRAIKKYSSDGFCVETVEECDSIILDERERYWIAYYQSNNKNKGYNLTDGGDAGSHRCPDRDTTRMKKSIAQRGSSNSFFGRHHSADHRANISKPVVAYVDDQSIYMYYFSQSSAEPYGFQQSHITDCVNGKHKHHGKTMDGRRLCWRFATTWEDAIIKRYFLETGEESLTPSLFQNISEAYNYAS